MSRTKRRSVGLGLVVGLVSTGVLGHAASVSAGVPVATTDAERRELSKRIHQLKDGRYALDPNAGGERFSYQFRYLLPPGWQPGDAIVPQAGGSGMAPSDVISAYSIPSGSSAGGKIVAIIDSPDKNAFSDLTAYRAGYGLPALPKCTGAGGLPDGKTPCFAQVAEDGTASTGGDNANGDGETGLDMDMISAACPDCSILLVEINSLCTSNILAGVRTAAKLGAVATSISLGGPETTDPTFVNFDAGSIDAGNSCPNDTATTDPAGYSTPGNVVFVAAGDFGYLNEAFCKAGRCTPYPKTLVPVSPSYPASAPDVIAVGGTTLSGSGSAYTEVVWNGGRAAQDVTTSGCSTEFAAVPWQSSLLTATGCKGRATADLAAAANFSGGSGSGIAAYANGSWGQVIGTSASSPLVAGLFTRLGLADTMSRYIDWPYSNTSAFNDVTSGTDDVSSLCKAPNTLLCTAGTGWDGPTGVGTPNGTKLAALNGGTTPPYPTPTPGTTTPDAGTDATVVPPPHFDGGTGVDGSRPPHSDASPPPQMGDSGTNPAVDGGPTPTGDAGPATPPKSSGGGCAVTSNSTSGFGAGALLLGLVGFASRRRRSR